ncbi:LysR family transcriptional regulator [Phenylobacterium sp.]|jgi:DNA-binding transcriptional LysR family regulator|uniref:LysR family transcriptional regulator n=1 Tax=Phenylobacterium sp. TaxID=1871053 RepID=UPI002E30D250|nr:LysR family transcriptional regulator [Phenylobacterium sp.]HEX3364190.1 LysR family transcriptional regulator [Phenylobacterium sp.]
MDLRLLRYFVACVENKSMHAAAEVLHVSQPALSKAVHQLEAELGAPLLERRPRGVVPTPYGETLLRYAKMIDTELRRASAEIDAMRGATKGKINVGAVPTMIAPMTRAARQILQAHPGLKLEVRAAFSRELTTSLLDGELDLALILIPEGGPPPGLAFEPIRRTNPVIVARAEHPLAGRDKLALHDLAAFPWLAATYPTTHWRILNRVFLDAGVPPPQAAMEVSTVVFFAPLIRETDMLTIMPQSMLSESPEGAGLVVLPFDLPFPAEQIVLGYRENSYLLPGAKIVMRHIQEVCADQP